MARPILEPAPGPKWRDDVRELVHRLESRAPRGYDGVRKAPYLAQQTSAIMSVGKAYPLSRLDVIELRFRFRGSHAGQANRIVLVRLTRVAAVGLLKALREVPTIEVGFGGAYDASFRTWARQAELYRHYLEGGARAAPPGPYAWHLRCAVDLGYRGPGIFPDEEGRQAMVARGFDELGAIDPPHFTWVGQ